MLKPVNAFRPCWIRENRYAIELSQYDHYKLLEMYVMKILVPVKRVLDYNIKARAKADGLGVELAGLKMAMNSLWKKPCA